MYLRAPVTISSEGHGVQAAFWQQSDSNIFLGATQAQSGNLKGGAPDRAAAS